MNLALYANQVLQRPTRDSALRGWEEDEVAPQLNSQFSGFIHSLLLLFPSSLKCWQILHHSRPSTPPSLPDCSQAHAFLSLLLSVQLSVPIVIRAGRSPCETGIRLARCCSAIFRQEGSNRNRDILQYKQEGKKKQNRKPTQTQIFAEGTCNLRSGKHLQSESRDSSSTACHALLPPTDVAKNNRSTSAQP